jgi:hypothetical protein
MRCARCVWVVHTRYGGDHERKGTSEIVTNCEREVAL